MSHCKLMICLQKNFIKMLAKSFLASAARTMTRSLTTSSARLGGDTMVLHKDTPENNADTPFVFTAENKARADAIMSIYPDGHTRAAVRKSDPFVFCFVICKNIKGYPSP